MGDYPKFKNRCPQSRRNSWSVLVRPPWEPATLAQGHVLSGGHTSHLSASVTQPGFRESCPCREGDHQGLFPDCVRAAHHDPHVSVPSALTGEVTGNYPGGVCLCRYTPSRMASAFPILRRFTDYSCDKHRFVPRWKREHSHPYARLRPQPEYPLRGPQGAAFGKSNRACADLGKHASQKTLLAWHYVTSAYAHVCRVCLKGTGGQTLL